MTLSEGEITKQIRSVLNSCRIWHWKHWSGPMTYPKGISDIIGIKTVKISDLVDAGVEEVGIFLAAELKHGGWTPPEPGTKAYKHFKEQEDFIFQVNQAGGIGFFAQSVEEVVERLGLEVKLYPLFKRG